MSVAGRRSSQGDDYQIRVAMHWLIRLLEDDDLAYIQAEVMSLPGGNYPVSVDDVVVTYKDGRTRFIQAKKNQPRHREWKLSDRNLQDELRKARDQLERLEDSVVAFYSRSPFGELKKLAEECRTLYSEFPLFSSDAPDSLRQPLEKLAKIIDRSEEKTHQLVQRIVFGPTREFEEWDDENHRALERLVTQADTALTVLEGFLRDHQSGLRGAKHKIERADIETVLTRHRLALAPSYSAKEILQQFRQASGIGRNIQCTIAGERIDRPEQKKLIEFIEAGYQAVLVTDRPGSGKTCLLLSLADYIEVSTSWGLLFIKGDLFSGVETETDLTHHGMPEDIIGKCARLALFRKVVVIIDSLDVLALNREHGTLQVFLSLLDRLERLDNVTVIAACRSFDLEYDPILRERQWGEKLFLSNLDFDAFIKPLLEKWGVNHALFPDELKRMLGLPQNLRLFEYIANRVEPAALRSPYHLQDAFIEEIIVKDKNLGRPAITALQNMAAYLAQNRVQSMPKAALATDEATIHRLVSQDVLVLQETGRLTFTHQTLLDALIVRDALAKGLHFAEFILTHPPFPFIRPFVRAFLFCLRAHCPGDFSRQVWEVLSNEEIAYHLRRLVAESLTELEPEADDWPLIRRLFDQQPDLFRRLFWRVEGESWFSLLSSQWLSIIRGRPEHETWLIQFVDKLRVWLNSHPDEVISYWREALQDGWGEKGNLHWPVIMALNKFDHWQTTGVRELLDTLLSKTEAEMDFLGKPISLYIRATGEGDDLLWHYISNNVQDEDIFHLRLGNTLRCDPHEFCDENFFRNRLQQSEILLDLVLRALEHWSAEDGRRYGTSRIRSAFLYSSSWEYRHTRHDMYHADSLRILLECIESALKYHARKNDSWWQANESWLRQSLEETLRYFLVQSYQENIQDNIMGIETILQDTELFRFGQINYELGRLMRSAYPAISAKSQENNQRMILNLYADEEFEDETPPQWVYRSTYEQILWVPVIFRTPETQRFIDTWHRHFGPELPEPQIHSWGGKVSSPISHDNFLSLSDAGLFRLFQHYNDYKDWSERVNGGLTGGRDQIQRIFRECCARHPVRYIPLLPVLIEQGLHIDYVTALIDGLSDHLCYRFGNLRPSNDWEPEKPLPQGEELAITLLTLLERHLIIWEKGWTAAHALEACCHVLRDEKFAERLTSLLFRLVDHEDPNKDKQVIFHKDKKELDVHDLASIALNSVRGIAAKSAMILCNRLVERGVKLSESLLALLWRFSNDPVAAVRVSILRRLPYLMHLQQDLGWSLFHDIFQERKTHLWVHAEQCLYYQYNNYFERVRPWLERLFQEALVVAGEVWGRIATLASLSGHMSQKNLFDGLHAADQKGCWKGATQVFAANINILEHTEVCEAGLLYFLQQKKLQKDVLHETERCFGSEKQQNAISEQLALAFVNAIQLDGQRCNLFHFLEWLSVLASRNPIQALGLCEALANKLESLDPPCRLWHTEPLVAALVSILREADETDNPDLIQRAIALQDRFLQMDLHGLDAVFEQTG